MRPVTLLSTPKVTDFSLHSYLNINAYGTDQFLRHTLRARLIKIGEDDKVRRAQVFDHLFLMFGFCTGD